MAGPLIAVDRVSHWFGTGALRKQILCDVSAEVQPGEIVILTGPSGSGKTTLLTLVGGLRAAQEGSVRILGQELHGASETTLVEVRRKIGYIFQLHNLLDALTVTENVEMGLQRTLGLSKAAARTRALEMLASVGLQDRAEHHPDQLSGGQKQRVAIARALAGRPSIILADEPTASLDKQSGREVVDRIHDLAKQEGCAVVLVTHDNRILDIADRIIHLEEGRLSSFAEAVRASAQQLLGTLAKSNRAGEVRAQVAGMTPPAFAKFLKQVTGEAEQLLEAMTLGTDQAFELMLEAVLEAVTYKVGQVLDAERVSLFLADDTRGELWSKVAQSGSETPVEIRIPATTGIVGHVYRSGTLLNVPDAYESPLFNRDVDRETGFRTHSVLSLPLVDLQHRPFAVLMLLNKRRGTPFDADDERTATEMAGSLGVILQTWHTAHHSRRAVG
jgi:putative ABC transport system ATP-binding protein